MSIIISDTLSAFGKVTITKGDDTTNNRSLNGIAPIKSHYGVEYYGELNDYEVFTELSAKSVMAKKSSELGIGEKSTSGYTTVDLHSSFVNDNGFTTTISVNNIFDRTTYEFLSYGYQALDYADMGRNVKVNLRYEF